jgi:hypothetical protein
MHFSIAHLIFIILSLLILLGIFIIIRNEIKIKKFSARITKRLKGQPYKKVSQLKGYKTAI